MQDFEVCINVEKSSTIINHFRAVFMSNAIAGIGKQHGSRYLHFPFGSASAGHT